MYAHDPEAWQAVKVRLADCKLPEYKVRRFVKDAIADADSDEFAFADAAANHHIAAYRASDGRIVFKIVSLREAARRIAAREPIVTRGNGAHHERFVMTLAAGETIEFPPGNDHAGLRIVTSVWSSGVVVTEGANDAEGHPWRPSIGSIVNAGARKVSIDPIGRVRPAGD
jgi:CRISPR-associated endonuclease Csn1